MTKKQINLITSLQRLTTNRKDWAFTFLRYLSLKGKSYRLTSHEQEGLQLLGHHHRAVLGDTYHTCDATCTKYRVRVKKLKAVNTPLFNSTKFRGEHRQWGEGTDVTLTA